MSEVSNTPSVPPCESECHEVFLDSWRETCAMAGVEEIEAHVTHVPPLVSSGYDLLAMRCPHGVLWYAEPTSEQIAKWAKAGVA